MYDSILHPLRLDELAKNWLLEDTSHFDFGSGVVEGYESEFVIFMKSPGVLAGIPFANAVFAQLGLTPEWFHRDGEYITPILTEMCRTSIAKICGPANKLLLAERVVLNVLSRASGVATITSKLRTLLTNAGWKGVLAGTRKTTPGFRMVEKYALLIGGADMHRYDLSSMVMLKDNHVSISGSIGKAIEKAHQVCGFSLKIEVECRSLQDALDAGNANCDIIMLDNFKPQELQQIALTLKLQFPSILIEASGGITEENIQAYVCPWIDIISSSSLVQGYPTIDFSMKART